MALLKKYILEHLFCEGGPENVANVETEVVAGCSYGRSCTEINDLNMDGIEIDAVEVGNKRRDDNDNAMIESNNAITNNGINSNSHNTPKWGCHHVFKSTTTPSSHRVHAAYNATTMNNIPQNKNAKKRSGKKRKKWRS
jgi:hypothetical protein